MKIRHLYFLAHFCLVLLIIFSGCSTEKWLVEHRMTNPVLAETPVYRTKKRQIAIDIFRITDKLPVTIYGGEGYDNINREKPLVITSDSVVILKNLSREKQHFFEIVPENGSPIIVAERHVPLEGTHNFRDLGGYTTTDGKMVKWGEIYRSDHLGKLKESSWNFFSSLDVRTIYDLRSAEDNEREPDLLPEMAEIEAISLPVYEEGTSRKSYYRMLRKAKPEDSVTYQLLIDANRRYIEKHNPEFSTLLKYLVTKEEGGFMYHCSAGKDRTGFTSAIILLALGVPKETVMRDYLASNYYRAPHNKKLLRISFLVGINKEVLRPILTVYPQFINEAFVAIEEHYGSIDNYLKEGLGITDEMKQTLLNKYLVPHNNTVQIR